MSRVDSSVAESKVPFYVSLEPNLNGDEKGKSWSTEFEYLWPRYMK